MVGETEERFSNETKSKSRARYTRRLKILNNINVNYKPTGYVKKKLSSEYFTLDKRAIDKILKRV